MSVDVENLTKRFTLGGTPAVSAVTFSAPTGATTALLGPSGAGKSTVLRLIGGLELPDAGRIRIEGEDCSSIPIQKRGVGFVFQNYALFQHMTVRENIAFGLNIRKVPRAEVAARVDELLHLVQLEDFGSRHPAQLSGGQRQRIAFARALAVRPKVLLLDEPFGALDTQVRVELRALLQDLHSKTHVTTILVTHDQSEALEVSQHVVVMLEGQVVQAAPPQEVYDHPATPFVAAFLGGANVFRGQIRAGRAEIGSLVMDAPASATEGQIVHAFVRPHDVTLAKASEAKQPKSANNSSTISIARLENIKHIGGHVKISLALQSGETVTVEVSRPDFEALDVVEGDRVFVDVRSAKIFIEDFAI